MTKCDASTADPPPPDEGGQSEVFAFLADPRAYSGVGPVKRVDTQGAAVFLAGGDAYKALRAIRLPFLDFSTLDKRRAACAAEIVANRDNAPGIYLGVTPIVRRGGALAIGGEGEVVEWTTHMRRFDENATLDRVAERGELSPELIRDLAAAVRRSHDRAPLGDARARPDRWRPISTRTRPLSPRGRTCSRRRAPRRLTTRAAPPWPRFSRC